MKKQKMPIEKLVVGGILTALVVVLQYMGSFIRFGTFSVSLVLIPIVLGAATCGPLVSAWLGLVFGVVVLITDAAAFLGISVAGTVITVLLKGILCGLVSGLVYHFFEKKNAPVVATVAAAVVCPLVNTGIFLLGCVLFFFESIREWGVSSGFSNVFEYMMLGLVGINFVFEFAINLVLSPVLVRLLHAAKDIFANAAKRR